MNPEPPQVNISVTGPDGLIAIVPQLLGFHPERSAVITGATGTRHRISLVLRYDLPEPPDQQLSGDIAAHAAQVLRRQQMDIAAILGYGPGALVNPVIDCTRQQFAEAGITLVEALRVHDGRYWSYLCASLACCPPDGRPVPAAHPAAIALDARGLTAAASRDAVAASVAPVQGPDADAMITATVQAVEAARQQLADSGPDGLVVAGRGAVRDAVAAYRVGGALTSAAAFARLAVALTMLPVRDDAWARMDPKYHAQHVRLWTEVTRRARPGHVAAPACLLAFTAWQAGNGALANVALDRALADDPGYSMAHLLRGALDEGLPPSVAVLPMTPEEVAASYKARQNQR